MPKDKSRYSKRLRRSPYHRSSGSALPMNKKDSEENIKEWEDARCPVCMEQPHNAVLLVCSSRNKGCHPYMCDTSRRHSNCLDQFRKTFSASPEDEESIDASPVPESRSRDGVHDQPIVGDDKRLVCPLCRGQVNGWIVVEGARKMMNAKSRSCACETCEFSGTYEQLREHARVEHPLARPSEADPERQRDWIRMEQERDLQDFMSIFQPQVAEDGNVGVPQFLVLFRVRSHMTIHISRRNSMEDVDIDHERVWTPATSRSPARSSERRQTSRSGSMEDIDTEFEVVRTADRSPSPARLLRRQRTNRTSMQDVDSEFEQIGTPGRSSRGRLERRSSVMEDIDTEFEDVQTADRSPSPARFPRRPHTNMTGMEDIDTEFDQIGTPGRSSRRRLNRRSSVMEDLDTEIEEVWTADRSPSPARLPRRRHTNRSGVEDSYTVFEQIGTPGRSLRRRLNRRSSAIEDADTEIEEVRAADMSSSLAIIPRRRRSDMDDIDTEFEQIGTPGRSSRRRLNRRSSGMENIDTEYVDFSFDFSEDDDLDVDEGGSMPVCHVNREPTPENDLLSRESTPEYYSVPLRRLRRRRD